MKRQRRRNRHIRSERGILGMMLLLAVVTITLGVSSFAYDIGHNILVRSQLQTAADAGALAGAYDLCLSNGAGGITPNAATAATYATSAASDARAVCMANNADGAWITASQVTATPCQYSASGATPPNNYSSSYYMTVTVTRQIFNLFATLYGHPYDTISVTSVAGPIGDPNAATTAAVPFPLALYSGNSASGTHSWNIQAGTNTLNLGILPLLSNGSTCQFVSGPTGLLGGALATVGTGGNANPTMQMMRYFDPTQTNTVAPPSLSQGQTIMMLNPGVTGLNLTLTQAGPLAVENYMQSGSVNTSLLGLLNNSPSYTPGLASFLQNKTFMLPVVTNPNVSILSQPLASTLSGGVAGQITGFVPVKFSATNAQFLSGLTILGIVVLPPNFIVTGTVGSSGSNSSLPMNVGLVN
jgi:Flp pilus assembly protein TadG